MFALSVLGHTQSLIKPGGVGQAVASADLQQRYFMHQCEGDCICGGFVQSFVAGLPHVCTSRLVCTNMRQVQVQMHEHTDMPENKICIRVRMVRAKTGSKAGWLYTKHCCLPFCCILLSSQPTIVH